MRVGLCFRVLVRISGEADFGTAKSSPAVCSSHLQSLGPLPGREFPDPKGICKGACLSPVRDVERRWCHLVGKVGPGDLKGACGLRKGFQDLGAPVGVWGGEVGW